MKLRPSNLAPTVMVAIACLLPVVSLFLFLNGYLRGSTVMQTFYIHGGFTVAAVLLAFAAVITQIVQARRARGSDKQMASWASTGGLFVVCLVVVAVQAVIVIAALVAYTLLRMLGGGTV